MSLRTILIAGGLLLGAFSAHADDSRSLTVVFTNNIQGETDPCGCKVNPRGGLAQKTAFFQATRKEAPNSIYIDAGDAYFRGLTVSSGKEWVNRKDNNTLKQRAAAEAIVEVGNRLGQKVQGLGRRDFMMGLDVLAAIMQHARFPYVLSNIDNPEGRQLWQRKVIVETGGVKIGFIGLMPDNVPFTDSDQLKIHPPLEVAATLIKELDGKVDLIAALSNLDFMTNQQLAREHPDLDLIFGAGGGRMVDPPQRIGDTLIMEAHQRGKFVGRLDLTLDAQGNMDLDSSFERVKVASQLRRVRQGLDNHRKKGDPEEVYKDQPALLNIYQNYLKQEETLQARLNALPEGGGGFDYRLVPMDKDGPADKTILAFVEEKMARFQPKTLQRPPAFSKPKPNPAQQQGQPKTH